MDSLINKLPSFYDNGDIVPQIQKSFTIEKNILENELQELINQLFVETATWGLSFWEEFLDIPTDEDLTPEVRKSRVKSKITRAIPALTKNQLQSILAPYFESVEVNEYAKENRFEVVFCTSTVIGSNLSIAIDEIEESKPAHLGYLIGINYITKLVVNKIFNRWESDIIPVCGTIDCSYNEYISTLGKGSYNCIQAIFVNAFSELFNKVAEDKYIIGNGKSISNSISQIVNNLYSEDYPRTSENIYVELGGELNDC